MKPFYKSRTLWVNFIALIALGIQLQFGYVISPEIQGIILILVNAILRLDTDSALIK